MTEPDDLAERVYVLEAKDEIRRLMAAYLDARDVTHGSVADYFTDDAVWEGIGRLADLLGRHEGRSAIVERFAGPVPPGLHLIANESITVHGNDAVGYRLLISRAGDWTSRFIDDPPSHLWVRGVPTEHRWRRSKSCIAVSSTS